MKPRVTPLLPLVLMAFLGLLTFWLQYGVLEGFGGDAKPVGHDPDSIVENFTVQRLDDSGKLRYTFSAPKMMHFGDEAFLYGNVLFLREATPQRPEFRARTEFLHLLAEQGIARTDHTVTISEGRSILTGVGMIVNKNNQQFMLQSQVKGIFDVPSRK